MKSITLTLALVLSAALVSAQEAGTGEVNRGIFYQEGIASWYGAEFNGRPTASGEIFNDSLFTAAHPILPFGTMLKITSGHNHKTVTVRVNDRGPFVAARVIDLSRAAAAELDMISTGTAPVTIESLEVVTLPARRQTAPAGTAVPAAAPVQAAAPETVPAQAAGSTQTAAPAVPVMASVEGPSGLPALPGEAVRVRPASVEPYSAPPASAAAPVSSGTGVWNGASSAGAREQTGTAARLRPAIPETATGRHYRVQVGAYKQPRHAVEAFEKLKNAGFSPVYEKYDDYYRVVLGGLRQEDLKTVAERLGGAGFRDALLREE